MHPTIELGPVVLHSFTVMVFAAFVVGGWTGSLQAARYGVDRRIAWDILPFAVGCALVGAVLYSALTRGAALVTDPIGTLRSTGLVFYGGLAGGMVGAFWRARSWPVPLATIFDGASAPLGFGYALGRIGCFLVGDDYGRPSQLPWAVAFAEGAPPTTAANLRALGADIPAGINADALVAVHPTQLYEAAAGLLIGAVCWHLFGRRLAPGLTSAAFLLLYGTERFLVEFIRLKDDYWLFGLTVAQWISLVLFAAGLFIVARHVSGRRRRVEWRATSHAAAAASSALVVAAPQRARRHR